MDEMMEQSVATAEPEKKRCIYYDAFTEEEKAFYEKVREAAALDEEIEMLRVKIYAMVFSDPRNMNILVRSLLCLDRLCRTNVRDFKRSIESAEKIKQNLREMFKGINMPLGLIDRKFS
jgi:hypothetical protein